MVQVTSPAPFLSPPLGEVGWGFFNTYEEGYARCVFVPQKPCASRQGLFICDEKFD
jgi:hypothetical protein